MPNDNTFEVLENQSLKIYNTFGVDANARYFVAIRSETQLVNALSLPQFDGLSRLILGGGSNLLLKRDFPGIVTRIELSGRRILRQDSEATYVEAAAGENWHDFVCWSLAQGLSGLENLSLIPGTVGASPIQNIGAYGVEMKDLFYELSAVDIRSGKTMRFDRSACRFGYRDSVFKQDLRDRVVITSVTFRLPHVSPLNLDYGEVRHELASMNIASPNAIDVSNAVCNIRRRKLPDPAEVGNAGSFFKNPIVDANTFLELHERHPQMPHYPAPDSQMKLSAGWLIDRAGWKGKTMGRAGVHSQHALVLINRGGASGEEIFALAQAIKDSVENIFGVRLEAEPVIV